MNKQLFDRIIFNICTDYSVTVDRLKEESRSEQLTYPRQLIMYYAVKFNVGTYTEIGAFFNRNHTTVGHSVQAIQNYRETNSLRRETIDNYSKKFQSVIEFKTMLELFEHEIKELTASQSLLELRYLNLRERISQLKESAKEILI